MRYRLQAAWSTVAEKEALTSRIPQVRQLLRSPGSCLVDNSTLLNAMCDAVEREPTQLLAPVVPTERPRSRLPFCIIRSYCINFLCMFIYDFSCLDLVSVPCTIHFLHCYLAHEFCAVYVGLITLGGTCACPGVVFVRYALRIYVLCKCVMSVIYAAP